MAHISLDMHANEIVMALQFISEAWEIRWFGLVLHAILLEHDTKTGHKR